MCFFSSKGLEVALPMKRYPLRTNGSTTFTSAVAFFRKFAK
jgi:hypothetical protein